MCGWRRLCWIICSVLLAEDYDVTVLEIDNNKIDSINNRSAFIEDKDIQDYFSNKG